MAINNLFHCFANQHYVIGIKLGQMISWKRQSAHAHASVLTSGTYI